MIQRYLLLCEVRREVSFGTRKYRTTLRSLGNRMEWIGRLNHENLIHHRENLTFSKNKGPAFTGPSSQYCQENQKENLAPNSPVNDRGTTVLLGLMKPSGLRKLVA